MEIEVSLRFMGSFVCHQETKYGHFEIIVKDSTCRLRGEKRREEKGQTPKGCSLQTERDLLQPLQRLFVKEEKINRRHL